MRLFLLSSILATLSIPLHAGLPSIDKYKQDLHIYTDFNNYTSSYPVDMSSNAFRVEYNGVPPTVSGMYGRAFSIGGANSYALIPFCTPPGGGGCQNTPGINLTQKNITIAMLVKIKYEGDVDTEIFSFQRFDGNPAVTVKYGQSAKHASFRRKVCFSYNAYTKATNSEFQIDNSSAIDPRKWTLLTVVFNSSNPTATEIHVYANGKKNQSPTSTSVRGTILDQANAIKVLGGGGVWSGQGTFDIDFLAVWLRVLSEGEISQMWSDIVGDDYDDE